MKSIYAVAMGSDFARLHPAVQRRFGFSSADNVASIGRGVMEQIWHGPFYTLPFLHLGSVRRIMFPEQASQVPFTIENYAYRDCYGRETVTWIRRFATPTPRRFDAYMVFSQQRGCIVDYLGTHQHLAVDIQLAVDERGGLRLHSAAQRFYEGWLGFSFPLAFSGVANVCEWFDESSGKFRIEVQVHNKIWGPLFGYHGWFTAEWKPINAGEIPMDIKPSREEMRE